MEGSFFVSEILMLTSLASEYGCDIVTILILNGGYCNEGYDPKSHYERSISHIEHL